MLKASGLISKLIIENNSLIQYLLKVFVLQNYITKGLQPQCTPDTYMYLLNFKICFIWRQLYIVLHLASSSNFVSFGFNVTFCSIWLQLWISLHLASTLNFASFGFNYAFCLIYSSLHNLLKANQNKCVYLFWTVKYITYDVCLCLHEASVKQVIR